MSNSMITLSTHPTLRSGMQLRTPSMQAEFLGDAHVLSKTFNTSIRVEDSTIAECHGSKFIAVEFSGVPVPKEDREAVKKTNLLFKSGVTYFYIAANLTNIHYSEDNRVGIYTFRAFVLNSTEVLESEAREMFPHCFESVPVDIAGPDNCGLGVKGEI